MNILLGIILGGLFGFALYVAGATAPKKILEMLRLEDLTLAKIILFAIGFSSVLLSILSIMGVFDLSHLSIKSMHLGVVFGGMIFGFGFGSIGTCPGTCVGAVGGMSGIKKAVSAIVGGLLGAFSFSLLYGQFKSLGLFSALDMGKVTLFNISEKFPSVFNVGFTGLLVVGAGFMLLAYFLPKSIIKS